MHSMSVCALPTRVEPCNRLRASLFVCARRVQCTHFDVGGARIVFSCRATMDFATKAVATVDGVSELYEVCVRQFTGTIFV
jgi:hypothetical protein